VEYVSVVNDRVQVLDMEDVVSKSCLKLSVISMAYSRGGHLDQIRELKSHTLGGNSRQEPCLICVLSIFDSILL
jgi:hypothetical protein